MDIVASITEASKAAGIETTPKAVAFALGFAKARSQADEKINTALAIVPRFTVLSKEKAEPIMAEFVKRTKTEEGCLYYGWSMNGDSLVCEETYVNAAAVLAHLDNVGELVGQITAEGIAKLDSIALHGPASEIDKCRATFDAFKAQYFVHDSSVQNQKGISSKIIRSDLSIVTIRPYFTVHDFEKARPVMEDFVKRTETEEGMVLYGWDVNGNQLHCRESYINGDAVNAHLANVGACIGAILAEGVATLDKIAIHGPAAELEKIKAAQKTLDATYYATHSGFQQFA